MKIALDAMGGDFAPDAIIDGAIMASQRLEKDANIILVGKKDVIESHLKKRNFSSSGFNIVHAEEVIEMGEHPTKALSQKPRSSIAIGYHLLKSKEVDAFCSAGNTGAMMVGAMFSIKAIDGVLRPCIANVLPKTDGRTGIFLDVGANADCKPEVLEQFGEIGAVYARYVLNIPNPKVGLMNLGEEEGKGTLVTQAAHQLLKANRSINFIGNIEGRDLFNDRADVIVCDGFTGNVILKMAESIYDIMASKNMTNDPFFDRFNYEAVGGSPILGINGNVIIGHGVSSPLATSNMLGLAYQLVKADIPDHFKETFSS
jgi:glycerol-3-phosphate acyltransferase PlsX